MKRSIAFFFFSFFLFSTAFSHPVDTSEVKDTTTCLVVAPTTYYVHALDGLKLRYEPSFRSPVITVLDYGEEVTKLDYSTNTNNIKVGYTTGQWIHAYVGGLEGYIFDGFVSALPIPEYLPHLELLGDALIQYALDNYEIISSDTIYRSSEMDDRYYGKYQFHLEGDVRLAHHIHWQSEATILQIPNIRIMDAYQLVLELLTVAGVKDEYGNGLLFKANEQGEIYEISDRLKEDIIIKKQANGSVQIEFKTYAGC